MRSALKFVLLCCFITLSIKGFSDPKQSVQEILSFADIQINGPRPSDIQVHDERFYERVLKEGSLGFGESYMDGWWDAKSLDECMFKILRANLENRVKPTWGMRFDVFKAKIFNMQNKGRSAEVIEQHYEIGDDLYEYMLGDTLAYTCAYWKNASNLDQAQEAKFDLIAKKLGLQKGMKVLDLGCGWGGFSRHIAQNYGVEVVAVNLSEQQAAYVKKICVGLPVEVRVQDYRDTQGTFDRIISIGLMEHVGQKNYRGFMELAHRCLTDDGLLLVHTIGRNTSVVTTDPWINKYIFPNAHLPSNSQLSEAFQGLFVMEDWHNFSTSYDKTLMAWYENFDRNWDKIKAEYPDPFYRMWKYYLLSCAGGFRARSLQLWQIVLSKQGVLDGYNSIR
ncbi:MAG: cyclopropane fatty acyl phospholipid synthase [Chlamydiae bacterium]|jgi:cyclopropane-fatty-acyl-phospholipid synthase|nr:cyclopropane fatty acyl phospholipid synthase [Chlamydiota bacterium]